ncbi:MAG: hypothetical protein NVSMB18_19590 [Acetobacteraceae bacterium]
MPDGMNIKAPHEIIDTVFVETPGVKEALRQIEILHKHGIRRDCCEGLLLVGPSRVGKSAVVEHYKGLFPERTDGRQMIRPVMLVRLTASTKLTSLVSATLRAMGDPRPDYGTPEARTARVLKLLELQRVEVLIYDEFHHVINSDTDKIAYDAGEAIKSILNEKICRVVLCGVSHADRVVHSNEQLPGRLRTIVRMVPADWRDANQRRTFRVFLHAIESALGLPSPSELGSIPVAHRIHHFSRGLCGFAHNLIREALLLRYLEGEVVPCITTDLLARAADSLLLREPVRRINAFRVTPPEEYEPAPMYESLKEPSRGRGRGGRHADHD